MQPVNTRKLKFGKIFLLIYGVLLVASILVQRFSELDNSTELLKVTGQGDIQVIHIPDPVLKSNTLPELLTDHFSVYTFSYDAGNGEDFSYKEYASRIFESINSSESKVHIVGEGIGASIAFHLFAQDPDSFNSLTLISGSGVEEPELLGRFEINHSIYLLQYGYNIFLKYLVPHFGMLKDIDNEVKRASIQYMSDQRTIRPLLHSIDIPVLIQHYENSSRIPLEVSKEHSRLIPQSELKVYDTETVLAVNNIIDFINASNYKEAIDQNSLSTQRVIQSLLPFDINGKSGSSGLKLALLMIAIILATLISEDLTCIVTGLMISQGLIGFFPGVFACLAGIFIGDILLFLAGKWLASGTLTKAPLKWFITEKDIKKSYNWFKAKGPSIIIASRFIPGTRLPTYFSAGAIGASFWMFILYFGVASLIWTPILVGLAVLLGQEMVDYFVLYQEYALWILLGVFLFFYLLFKLFIPMLTYRGRRLLYGKWNRIVKWEFWSLTVVYTPVMIFIMWLWVKYRSVTLFVASNPGIEEGGFIKESKSAILDNLKRKDVVAKYHCVSISNDTSGETNSVLSFMEKQELEFPIVLKPDVGERGSGVQILKNEKELKAGLATLEEDHIVQEYITGEEYGVFYYRYPAQDSGQIYSITKKVYLELYSDGTHTLEELILKDDRAVCLAEIHFEKHLERLYNIPEKGEKISLVEIGTHSRGALFFDAEHLISDKLVRKIDEISKSFDGFYFGRYDIKVPSEEHLKRGENISIIELNGVTSESTNIYDPKHSFFFGLKTLMKQWAIAYEIGSQVKANNPDFKLPSVSHLLSLLR
ncbi:MAG: VTT domain-containing protein [Balneolaceae bacterium]